MAVDIACSGIEAMDILWVALGMRFTRVGINQKGSGRFIHLGMAPKVGGCPALRSGATDRCPLKVIWSCATTQGRNSGR